VTEKVVGPVTRPDPPATDDWGTVVRPIGSGPSGEEIVLPLPSAHATLTAIDAATSPITLLAANANRIGFSIRNTSASATLYVKASTTAGAVSATFHSVALGPGGYYEDPYRYVGEVDGVWTDPTGEALVTEYVP